ncbi:MAG: DNA gyrase inhibitor YacG [Paracoccaceae bacterium]
MADKAPRGGTPPPLCPICNQRPSEPAFRPFCSKRCADVDLGRWLNGAYAVPGEPADAGRLAEDDD